jgi:hypothetical protein
MLSQVYLFMALDITEKYALLMTKQDTEYLPLLQQPLLRACALPSNGL